jgi:hypothetical protein
LDKQVGFQEVKIASNAQTIGGNPVDLVHMIMKADDWPAIRNRLMPMAKLLEAKVCKWERKIITGSADISDHMND